MKFKIAPLIIISLLLLSCKKTKPTTTKVYSDDRTEILNGCVKEIITTSSFSKYNFTHLTFDQQGNMLALSMSELGIVSTGGKTDSTIEKQNTAYSYHYKDGVISSITNETIGRSGKDTSIWNFDSSGRMIGDPGDTTTPQNRDVRHYKYDKNGLLVEVILSESAAKIEPMATRYKYDKQNRVIEETEYEPVNLLLFKKTYEYAAVDSQKNWIKAIVRYIAYPPLHFDSRTDTITRKITYY